MVTIIAGFIVAALLYFRGVVPLWNKYKYSKDIVVLEPAIKRTDLYYGYYSCFYDQVAETKDHINLFMESQFQGPDVALDNILKAGMDTALDVMFQVYEKVPGQSESVVRNDAEQRLRDFFTFLRNKGALKYVKILYPSDEPNNTVLNLEEQQKGTSIVRKVAKEFSDLDGVKLAVIFAADKEFIGKELYDYVGFDDYDKKSHVLVNEQYQKLKQELLPHQKTIIVPGGAYGQDPTPFVNFAHANSEVGIVMPFLWYDDPWGGVKALGIRSGALKNAYIAAGHKVIQH